MKTKPLNIRVPEDLYDFVNGYEKPVTKTEIVIQAIREYQFKVRKFERMQELHERKKETSSISKENEK